MPPRADRSPSHARPRVNPSGDFTCIVRQHAVTQPATVAIYFPRGGGGWDELSYADLERRTDAFAAFFCASGLPMGSRVQLLLKPCVTLYPLILGAVRAGLVPVFLDPAMGLRNVLSCIRTVQPAVVVAPLALHIGTAGLVRTFQSVSLRIVDGRRGLGFGPTLAQFELAGVSRAGVGYVAHCRVTNGVL